MTASPDEESPLEKAMKAYQTGKDKLYKASGLEGYDNLGKMYEGLIKGYTMGKIDDESAMLAITFSELLEEFKGNPIVKDEMANFEKEMFKQPSFKTYLAVNALRVMVSSQLRKRTAEQGVQAATQSIEVAEKALRAYGAEFKVKES